MINTTSDQHWMQLALQQAEQAQLQGEVPIGAVLVAQDTLIATGFNQPIMQSDPSAHAEIVVLRNAGQALKNYRLINTTLYVTLEPCLMCIGGLVHARIQRLVFGAYDPKSGAVCSVCQALDFPHLNHKINFNGGILADECSKILKEFFLTKRS